MSDRITWRCFHCDEVFETVKSAARHFGANEDATPACKIANSDLGLLGQLREVETELAKLWSQVHNEGTSAAQSMLAQDSRHRAQLVQAEESGYAKGLRDADSAAVLELQQIDEMLMDGQGDDEGMQVLPDFVEGSSVCGKVESCLHLLERRRDIVETLHNEKGAEAP